MKTQKKEKIEINAIKIGGGVNDGSQLSLGYLNTLLSKMLNDSKSKVSITVSAQAGITNMLETAVEMLNDATCTYDNDARGLITKVIDSYKNSEMFAQLSNLKLHTNKISDFEKFAHSFDSLCDGLWMKANEFFQRKKKESLYRDEVYNALVPYGELLAENLYYHYIINYHTDSCSRISGTTTIVKNSDGTIDVESTHKNLINSVIKNSTAKIYLTAGFICSDDKGNLSTLGREGSDLTCICIAALLEAKNTKIYKQKPKSDEEVLESDMSYSEAEKFIKKTGINVLSPKIFPFIEEIRKEKKYKIPTIKIVDFNSQEVMSTITI